MQCPKCNMNLKDDAKFCMYCGSQFNNENTSAIQATNSMSVENKNQEVIEDNKGLILLIISTINMVCSPFIAGGLLYLFVIYMILGGALYSSSEDGNNFVSVLIIYVVLSCVFFLFSYIGFFKRSKTKKRKIKLIILGIIILLLAFAFIFPIISIANMR